MGEREREILTSTLSKGVANAPESLKLIRQEEVQMARHIYPCAVSESTGEHCSLHCQTGFIETGPLV